jgi:branched-chain amino acid transport system ATP-binding protein
MRLSPLRLELATNSLSRSAWRFHKNLSNSSVAGGADVILLDEPTAGMSHAETERAVALIRRLTEGRTLLIVEHDISVVFGLADRISVLVYGQIIASGTPEEIRGNPKVKEAYLGEEGA